MATRKNTFLLKRSNVAGAVPAIGAVQLGELALNTADVKLYASGTTTNSILPIGWDRIARTGDTMTGNFSLSGSNIGLIMSGITNEPSSTTVGTSMIYTRSIAGLEVLKTQNSSGIASPVQNAFWQNNISFWNSTNVLTGLWHGTQGIGAGVFSQGLPTNTSTYTTVKRGLYATSATTTNQQVGQRNTDAMFFRGNVANRGGFFFFCRFGTDAWTAGDRLFVGLTTGSTAIVTVNPSTLLNLCGFGIDAGDTAITFMHNGASATTKDAIAGQPTLSANTGYDAYIYMAPNSNTIGYRLDNINAGTTIINTTISTNIPVANVMMNAVALMSNGANTTATAANIGINRIYIETVY